MKTKDDPCYRQGDILLEPIKDLDLKNLRPCENNIVEKGEISGHRHWFDTPHQTVYEDDDGTKYVHLIEGTVLVHGGENEDPVWLKDEAKKKDVHIALVVKANQYISDEKQTSKTQTRTKPEQ